jgi:GNAT superfamily N-acetyltransferase
MLHADLTLARRLEAAEAAGRVDIARAHAALFPAGGAAVEAIADGFAIYNPVSPNSTRAFALGLHGAVTGGELDRMEEFFRRRGQPPAVQICSLGDPSLLELLGGRAYRLAEWTTVLVRRLDSFGPAQPPTNLRVQRVGPAQCERWVDTVARGFSGRQELTPAERELGTLGFHLPAVTCFLALVDDEPAGGGAVALHEGVATLFAAGTLPEFRRRGVQGALMQARLASAAEAGCELATTGTVPGGGSQRNAERQGFRVAYVRALLLGEPGA